MAFSFVPNFIHFPISISNSNHLNHAAPPLSAKGLRAGSLRVKCHSGKIEPENKEPLETNDRLYKGVKNKDDIAPSSDVMANQPTNFLNSILFLQPFWIKLNFLSNIMKALQKSLVFVVQPTTKNGSMVGIKWKVGWNKVLMKSDKGVTIQSYHSYVGNLLIGNLETMIEPLLQLWPMAIMKNWKLEATKERRVASLCLGFFLLIFSLFSFHFSVH